MKYELNPNKWSNFMWELIKCAEEQGYTIFPGWIELDVVMRLLEIENEMYK